eukprot:gene40-43_t
MSNRVIVIQEAFQEERKQYQDRIKELEDQLVSNAANATASNGQSSINVVEKMEKQMNILQNRLNQIHQQNDLMNQSYYEEKEKLDNKMKIKHNEGIQTCQRYYQEQVNQREEQYLLRLEELQFEIMNINQTLYQAVTRKTQLEQTIERLNEEITEEQTSCQQELSYQRSLLTQYYNEEYLYQYITNMIQTNANNLTCPICEPINITTICSITNCEHACKMEISDIKRKWMERNEDVDFARLTAKAIVVETMTSPTFFPSQIYISSMVKSLMSSIGLAQYTSIIPDWKGEKVLRLLGLNAWVGSPEDALVDDLTPGACWPMAGSTGNLTIHLVHPVVLTGVSVEHIAKEIAADWRTAPQEFSLYVSSSEVKSLEMVHVLDGRFDWAGNTSTSQFIPLPQPVSRTSLVTLAIKSNYGHPDYTCLYKLRLHGHLPTTTA